MKRAVLGTLVGLGLVTAAVAVAEQRGDVFAQRRRRRRPVQRPARN